MIGAKLGLELQNWSKEEHGSQTSLGMHPPKKKRVPAALQEAAARYLTGMLFFFCVMHVRRNVQD